MQSTNVISQCSMWQITAVVQEQTVRIVLKPSGQNWLDKIKTIRTLLYQSRQCWKCTDNVKPVRTVSTLYVQFSNHPDCFKTVWTVLELSGQV